MDIIRTYQFQNFKTDVYTAEIKDISHLPGSLFVFDSNTIGLVETENLPVTVIPAGEEHKQWTTVESILNKSFEEELDRSSIITGVGGGVLCDLTAFAASVFMRGCKLRLIPTTLLAMVDAAMGGKTGMDHLGYKNSVGSFYPASELLLIPDFIQSLPEKQFKNGMGEVIKTAMLGDPDLYKLLLDKAENIKKRDKELMKEIVLRCVAVKGKIVEEDLKESGVRAHLNLGHTFAHGLETVSDFSIEHGEAVGWGLYKALQMGDYLGLTDKSYKTDTEKLLALYGFTNETIDFNPEKVLEAMNKDKKKIGNDIRFVLQSGLCQTEVRTVKPEIILSVLDK